MAQPVGDSKYVFDAPQYHDFGEASTGSRASAWFDAQTGE